MIKQFVENVCWGELDYLLIDTPPGTSDEHISIVGYLKGLNVDGAVLVTTPQAISLQDGNHLYLSLVKREINFCKKVGLKIVGLVENMSGFVCPHCAECTDLFSSGGGKQLALDLNLNFMGSVPIDPNLSSLMEKSEFVRVFKTSALFPLINEMVKTTLIL